MSIHRAKELVHNDLKAVNDLIISTVSAESGLIDDLSNHIIQSGGKRIRPLLVLLTSLACDYKGDKHIVLAAMIEFFHTATLLHDDVVDESKLRRGRKTANSIWGAKASILVGDYLFTLYIDLMLQVDSKKIMLFLAEINNQITRGEIKQLGNKRNFNLSETDYFEIISAKTSLLFAASTKISAILSEVGTDLEEDLYKYGLHLGNAYQIIDDMLDYSADEKIIGKNIGDDLADGKMTLPLIYILQTGTKPQIDLIQESISSGNKSRFAEVLDIINSTNALSYTLNIAQQEAQKAIDCLTRLPNSLYKTALIEIAKFSTRRDS